MSEMTVGSIRTTVNPPLASGIYEALLEKAERESAELADRLSGLELSTTQKLAELERELNNMQDQRDFAMTVIKNLEKERDQWKEVSLEQARWPVKGSEREARLITERDHYKQSLEEISTTIQEYKDSMVQEPAEDFIWAIKAWADKKLNEL